MKLVAVRFGDPVQEVLPGGQDYTYIFDLPERVKIGDWVYVYGGGGLTTAVVVGFPKRAPSGYSISTLSRIERPVREIEIAMMKKKSEELAKQRVKDFQVWWWHAAYCSGFTPNRPPYPLPEGFPVLHGDRPVVTRAEADDRGKTWWRIYRLAEREGKPQNEIAHYRAVADYWFTRRDAL